MGRCENFSVLMSVYINEEAEYLQEALHSVLDQTVKPAEIILIEDGPLTDSLYEVIERLSEESNGVIKRFSLEENGGLAAALNYGLQKCSYELVARMDSDDISLPNRFELQIQEFLRERDEGDKLVIVGSDIDEFETDKNIITTRRIVPHTSREIAKTIKWRCPFNHQTIMYKRTPILAVGGYPTGIALEDYALWVNIHLTGFASKNIPQSLVHVRVGNGMHERRGGKKYYNDEKRLQKYMYDRGIINRFEYFLNLLIRWFVRQSNLNLRKAVYSIFLRK